MRWCTPQREGTGSVHKTRSLRAYPSNGDYVLGEVDDYEREQRRLRHPEGVVFREDVRPLVLREFNDASVRRAQERIDAGNWPEFYFTAKGLRRKQYIPENWGAVPRSVWAGDDAGRNDIGKSEIKALFPGVSPFSTPKPEALLERIIHIATNPGDIVLDCFAGSGTTAAVAHKMGRRWVAVELLESTLTQFTLPRLRKVIEGEQGGISTTQGRADKTPNGLPDGVSMEDAQTFQRVLSKVTDKDVSREVAAFVKTLRANTRTAPTTTVNWRGGGSFTLARLEPDVFDVDETMEMITLSDAATDDTDVLVRGIAAHMRYGRVDHHLFHGRRGTSWLYVTREYVDIEVARSVVAALPAGHTVCIAATASDPVVAQWLREHVPGSSVMPIPQGLF